MSTSSNNNDISACANCGKGQEESVALKNCVACKMVKYCSRDCQKAHRSKHKKECRKRAAELHDEALFKQPPPRDDCPICFLRLPTLDTGWKYNACCGKRVCSGCTYAGVKMDGNADQLCPFCRAPAPETEEEMKKRVRKRVQADDTQALYELGCHYSEGMYGMPRDHGKALELWLRAGELGIAASYYNIAYGYYNGEGVTRDEKKATHYYELAAMGGEVHARNNLGVFECYAGNIDRALKHFMIAVGSGHNASIELIKQFYLGGSATRDDYAKALKAYQEYLVEIKSIDRDKAAASNEDEYKYYE